MTTSVTTGWGYINDVAELEALAVAAEGHGLTADAAQLRQAIEDLTVQTEYVDDLERLLGGDGNAFGTIAAESTFVTDFTALHRSVLTLSVTATMTPTLRRSTSYHISRTAPMTVTEAGVFHAGGPLPEPIDLTFITCFYTPNIVIVANYSPLIVSQGTP